MSADPVDQISRICDDADGDKLTRIALIIGEAPAPTSGNTDREKKLIPIDDPTFDAKDPFTRLFLLAEYWQRKACACSRCGATGTLYCSHCLNTMPVRAASSGNDEVEAMCEGIKRLMRDDTDVVAFIRKQAAREQFLMAQNHDLQATIDSLRDRCNAKDAQIAELQKGWLVYDWLKKNAPASVLLAKAISAADAAIAGKGTTAQTSADQTPATLAVAPKD